MPKKLNNDHKADTRVKNRLYKQVWLMPDGSFAPSKGAKGAVPYLREK